MAHRGRLNVLYNILNKPFRAIISEFSGNQSNPEEAGGSGDVKYHMGASADREFDGEKVHLSLQANPSHLEVVAPVVVEGSDVLVGVEDCSVFNVSSVAVVE